MSILIHVFQDERYLLCGPWIFFLSASLYEVIVSTMDLVIYPSMILSTQKSTSLEIWLLILFIRSIKARVHSVGSPPWKLFFSVVNLDNHSYNRVGNSTKKISWMFEYVYHYNHFVGVHQYPSLSLYAISISFASTQLWIFGFVRWQNVYLNTHFKFPTIESLVFLPPPTT